MLHELSLIFYDTGDHIEQIGSPKSCRITCTNLPTHTTKVLVHASPCEPVAYKYKSNIAYPSKPVVSIG